MIITKKQYNEAIEKAVEKAIADERAQVDKMMCDRDEERWRNERIENIERRMSSAFGDIDRRLTELEKSRNVGNDIAVCPKY
jgi:tetrahydromethanopterin S-methyltransferase subunit G